MKTTLLIFTATLSIIGSGLIKADNSYPPSGPYRSLNEENQNTMSQNNQQPADYSLRDNHNSNSTIPGLQAGQMPNPYATDMPEWVKQRQAEMQSRQQKTIQAQYNNRGQVPAWVKQQQADMQQWQMQNRPFPQQNLPEQSNMQAPTQWNQNQVPPMLPPGQSLADKTNRSANNMQPYFPAARGQVFGPGVPPPGYRHQPGHQVPQYRSGYPPVWR